MLTPHINIKLIGEGKVPTIATEGSVGYDVYLPEEIWIHPGQKKIIKLGIAVELPKGYFIELHPRSSLFYKYEIIGQIGIIDVDYRGEMKLNVWNTGEEVKYFPPNASICQLIIRKRNKLDFIVVKELTTTDRGIGGFGSTGK